MSYLFQPGTTFVQTLPPAPVPSGRPETEYKIVERAGGGYYINWTTWDRHRGCYGGWFRAADAGLFSTREEAEAWINETIAQK